jgi:hypothetical protein
LTKQATNSKPNRQITVTNEYLLKRGFNTSDIKFLCRRTGLKNEAKITSLIEEDEDLGLIMEQVSSLPLVRRQTTRLSLYFLMLLLVHKYSSEDITNKHKLFISEISSDYFCLIVGTQQLSASVDFGKPPDENTAKLIFVLNGVFGEYFSQFFDHTGKYDEIKKSHIGYILKGLERHEAEKWAEEGLEIMKRIADHGWLNRFTQKIR